MAAEGGQIDASYVNGLKANRRASSDMLCWDRASRAHQGLPGAGNAASLICDVQHRLGVVSPSRLGWHCCTFSTLAALFLPSLLLPALVGPTVLAFLGEQAHKRD